MAPKKRTYQLDGPTQPMAMSQFIEDSNGEQPANVVVVSTPPLVKAIHMRVGQIVRGTVDSIGAGFKAGIKGELFYLSNEKGKFCFPVAGTLKSAVKQYRDKLPGSEIVIKRTGTKHSDKFGKDYPMLEMWVSREVADSVKKPAK